MRVLAALFYLPSSYLLCLGNAAFALLRPDALSPLPTAPPLCAVRPLVYACATSQRLSRPRLLALSGWGEAVFLYLRGSGILRTSL
jgi:hypothetical protein